MGTPDDGPETARVLFGGIRIRLCFWDDDDQGLEQRSAR